MTEPVPISTVTAFEQLRSTVISNVIATLAFVAKDPRTCKQDREALARAAKAIATVGGRITREEIQGDMFAKPEDNT